MNKKCVRINKCTIYLDIGFQETGSWHADVHILFLFGIPLKNTLGNLEKVYDKVLDYLSINGLRILLSFINTKKYRGWKK